MKLKRKLYSDGIISGRELKFNTYDPLGDRSIIKFKSNRNPEPEEITEEGEEEIENKEDLNLPENEELEENYNNQIEDDEFDDDNEYKNYE